MSERLSLRLNLLDVQVVDSDSLPVGRVDDVELSVMSDGTVTVNALLTGQQALGQRLGGTLGDWMARTAQRFRHPGDEAGPTRLPLHAVGALDPMVTLTVAASRLPRLAPLERWLSDRLIRNIPGSDR